MESCDKGGSLLAQVHSPAQGLYELHMTWGLYAYYVEPLIHSQHGAIVKMLETYGVDTIRTYTACPVHLYAVLW